MSTVKKYFIRTMMLLFTTAGFSQNTVIAFKTNKKTESLLVENPFQNFIGEWTLKDNEWTQNWGIGTETITIPDHHTISTQINTTNTLFSIIDGPEPNGHIFWSYNPVTKVVYHLSSFGKLRAGVGEGSVADNGDVTLKISFEGEPKDTYRIYNYSWVNEDEYQMNSVQYGSDDKPTGLFYKGSFVRIQNGETELKAQIENILSVLDNNEISVEQQLEIYTDDIVHMAPGHKLNIGKKALGHFLRNQREQGEAKMKHEILEIEQQANLVIMRGQVKGSYYPRNESIPVKFRTKNLFVFVLKEGAPKIKKIIYNSSPNK